MANDCKMITLQFARQYGGKGGRRGIAGHNSVVNCRRGKQKFIRQRAKWRASVAHICTGKREPRTHAHYGNRGGEGGVTGEYSNCNAAGHSRGEKEG